MKTQMCNPLARLVSFTRVTLVGLALLGSLQQAGAQGTAFNYDGILDDSGGLATGVYDFTFSLSSSSNEVVQVGATITNLAVPVTDGTFTVTLNFGAGIFTGNPLWVGIGVRTNGAANFAMLSPLQPILPVPYAMMAGTASNLLGTLPATQLTGIVSTAQLSGAVVTNNGISVTLSGTFSGNGAGLTNVQSVNLAFSWSTNALTSSMMTGGGNTNWQVNFATNVYWVTCSNSICLSNMQNLSANFNWVDIYLINTNTTRTFYLSLASNVPNGGWTNGWPLTNSLRPYHLHGSLLGTNWTNAVWELSNPGL
jgi:hypothetical protein